jgi:hypothetical protein
LLVTLLVTLLLAPVSLLLQALGQVGVSLLKMADIVGTVNWREFLGADW